MVTFKYYEKSDIDIMTPPSSSVYYSWFFCYIQLLVKWANGLLNSSKLNSYEHILI